MKTQEPWRHIVVMTQPPKPKHADDCIELGVWNTDTQTIECIGQYPSNGYQFAIPIEKWEMAHFYRIHSEASGDGQKEI